MNGVWGLVREPDATPASIELWQPVIEQRRSGEPWSLAVVQPDGRVDLRRSSEPVQSPADEGGSVAVAALGDAQLFAARNMAIAIHGGVIPNRAGEPQQSFTQEHANALAASDNLETALTVLLTGIWPVTAVIGTRDRLLVYRRGDALYHGKQGGNHIATPYPPGARAVIVFPDRQVITLP